MQDIATQAGVGKATVSLALRDDPRIRPETRRKIKEVADRLGYRSNPTVANLMAQLRASREPKFQATLAFLNASPQDGELKNQTTFQSWLRGAKERAHALGYEIDYFWLHDPEITPVRRLKILQSRNIRGMILAAVYDDSALNPEDNILFPGFASVAVGRKLLEPSPHYACNDQYDTAINAVSHVYRKGYSRPGLVLSEQVDRACEYRFSAGYNSAQKTPGAKDVLPVLYFTTEAAFGEWFRKNKPDSILTDQVILREWVKNLPGGDKVGFVHLDWEPKLSDWAGTNQNNDKVGAAAIDILIGQIHRNESGLPPFPRSMMIGSTWVDGASLPDKRA
jgi:LacI family transcriptional regulator